VRFTTEFNREELVDSKCRKGTLLLSLPIADVEILLAKLISAVEQQVIALCMHSKSSRISIFETREGRERQAIEVEKWSFKYIISTLHVSLFIRLG